MQVKTVDLQTSQAVSAAIEKHGASREALIPILSEVNRLLGYIPAEAFTEIKRQLRLQSSDLRVYESQLYSLASFLPHVVYRRAGPARGPLLRERALPCRRRERTAHGCAGDPGHSARPDHARP